MQTLPLLSPPGSERACFICLEDDGDLVSCCSQCYGVTHVRCWRECRSSQRTNAIRTRMTGGSSNVRDPFLCSICKTGRARVQGETVTREWMEVVLSAVLARSTTRRGSDDNSQIDMVEDIDEEGSQFCCTRRCVLINLVIISGVISISVTLISDEVFSGSAVLLCTLFLLMQFLVVQITVGLARYRRLWRESHRPVNALIDQELSERRGRLFPSDLLVIP